MSFTTSLGTRGKPNRADQSPWDADCGVDAKSASLAEGITTKTGPQSSNNKLSVSGYHERSGLGRAVSLRRLGEPRAHQLRDDDRNVELPEHRFQRGQYGDRRADRYDRTRAKARQCAETDIVQHGDPPGPGVALSSEPRTHAERSGREHLDEHEEIGPGYGCEQIAAHRAKDVVDMDNALLEDIAQDHEG